MLKHVRTILIVSAAIGAMALTLPGQGQGNGNGTDAGAAPSPGGASFAGAFFISRVLHANGEQTIDPVGTALIWSLLAMSVVNVGLIGYLASTNLRKNIVPAGVLAETRKLMGAAKMQQTLDLIQKEESFFSQVMRAGLKEASHGYAAAIRALEQSADVAITRRMRPIELLYMFGMVSPMMGLLGTVYGIIFAFRVFVSMGGRASPALLAGGIGTALVATFWGLLVAIPALAAYSILRNKVDHLTMDAMAAAEELLGHLRPKPPRHQSAEASREPQQAPREHAIKASKDNA